MKPALRYLLACALLSVAGLGAQAQADEVLERYQLALTNLSESMGSLATDVTASRDELDRAAGALRFLAGRAGSPTLVESMERVFERARTAIQNRSQADLAVQGALLRGGFQRALYDSALTLLESERATALARLERLAADLSFDEQTRAGLAEVAGAAQARLLVEAAVAERVRGQLVQAAARFPQDRDSAYRALANAYGDFLLVQDSPRADPQLNAAFAGAAESLVGGRGEELSARVQRLAQSFERLAEAARAVPTERPAGEGSAGESSGEAIRPVDAASSSSAVAAAETAAPGELQAQAAATTTSTAPAAAPAAAPVTVAAPELPAAAGATGAVVAQSGAAGSSEAEGAQAAPVVATQPSAGPAPAQPPGANDAAAPAQQGNAAAGRAAGVLERDLMLAGAPAARVAGVASSLRSQGVESLADATSGLYSQAGRLVAALQSGDAGAAESRLGELSAGYEHELRSLVRLLSPAVDDRMARLLASASSAPGLRTQDALVLIGQIEAIDRLLAGDPASRVQVVDGETTILWSGWPRLAVLLVLALLAAIPLYLLNLAFGGGNRNWQLIGVALFLLLLPVIYEGLATLAAFVGELIDLPVLALGTTFSMFQSPIGQVAWAGLTLAGIVFAAAGLYGICVQFGLLGSQRATSGDSQTMLATAVAGDADTVVDWDEEF
jgi:hypothetical protein